MHGMDLQSKRNFLFYFLTTISNGQAYIESLLGIEIASLKMLHSVKIWDFFIPFRFYVKTLNNMENISWN